MIDNSRVHWIVVSLLAATATPALADPIRVTGGHLTVTRLTGVFELSGERDFSFSGEVHALFGVFKPVECTLSPGCLANADVSLRAHWSGFDIRKGVISFDGRTYQVNENGGASAGLTLDGPFVTPAFGPPTIVTAPFQLIAAAPGVMGSWFRFPYPDSEFQALAGSGTATITLSPHSPLAEFPNRWSVDSVRYDFTAADPVPEPATMLLVGVGIAGVARKVRNNRARC